MGMEEFMKKFFSLFKVYLRHAFRHAGFPWFSLFLSLVTVLCFVMMMFTAYPDDPEVFFPALTKQVNYRFDNTPTAREVMDALDKATRREDLQSVYAYTLVKDEPLVMVIGALDSKTRANIPVYGQFEWEQGEPFICALDNRLVPASYTLWRSQLPIRINGLDYQAVSSHSIFTPPGFTPENFAQAAGDAMASLTIDGVPAYQNLPEQKEELENELERALRYQSLGEEELNNSGVMPAHPHLGVYLPLDLYTYQNLPVKVLSVMFVERPSKARLAALDSAFDSFSHSQPRDIITQVNSAGHHLYNQYLADQLPRGLPVLIMMMLTQMTLWGAWLAGFAPLRARMRILGATRLQQRLALTLTFLCMQLMAALAATAVFLLSRKALLVRHWLWTVDLMPLRIALAGFLLLCLVYMGIYLISEEVMGKKVTGHE